MKLVLQFIFLKRNFLEITFVIVVSLVLAGCSEHKKERLTGDVPVAQDTLKHSDSTQLPFFVISDWGFSDSDGQNMVASEMSKIATLTGLKFILTCGDNFQIAGVSSINDSLWQVNYENVYNFSSLLVPWYPALGNHDYLGNPDAQVEYSTKNMYWHMPARYYTFVETVDSATTVRYIVLDTPGLISAYQSLADTTKYDTITQYCWFKNVLANMKEKWVIVSGHYPVFSASSYHGDTKEMKIMIKPLLDQYHVDFYICGHDHDFEHARDKGNTTDYIVNGTGGYLRPAGFNSRTIFSVSALGFTYISLSCHNANLYFITKEGIAYHYVIKK